MQIFYVPGITGEKCVMDRSESWHCIKVMRMSKGDTVFIIDGEGNLYKGLIINPDPDACGINISEITRDFEKRSYRLHIAISPVKNNERFEWFVEKSVELGIDEITPVICRNTEKQRIKSERINNIIISAMKQSIKANRTILNDICSFEDFIKSEPGGIKMIAHCNQGINRIKISDIYKKRNNAVILIGPEGDFTPGELEMSINAGFQSIHLGISRLRTETAGVAACHSVYFINQ